MVVHPGEQSFRVGDKIAVPRPARPARQMPVRVNHHDIKRDVVIMHLGDNILEILLRVCLVFGVPVTEHIIWRHGGFPSYLDKVVQRFLVILPITQEIHIQHGIVRACFVPRHIIRAAVEQQAHAAIAPGGHLVNHGPTRTRQDAVLQHSTVAVARGTVQRAHGAFQVVLVLLIRIPHDFPPVHLERYPQVVRTDRVCNGIRPFLIAQGQFVCIDI